MPPASLTISKQVARRFLLAHHGLLPPRRLQGKPGILDYLAKVGCIQFDPINVVGGNADLVLQSRIAKYRPSLLQELLYQDRSLMDGFDKVASIYQTKDWPYFGRFRKRLQDRYTKELRADGMFKVATQVREAIQTRGPLSSIEIEHDERMLWDWGISMRVVRAAMDTMYWMGELGIHHRVHTRRVFDLIENLLPKKLLERADPNPSPDAYIEWHVLRRVGGMGLAQPVGADRWLGMEKIPDSNRKQVFARLMEMGKVARVRIDTHPKLEFYVRSADLPTLKRAAKAPRGKLGAAFIAPLDNMMWQRDLLELLFDFYYRWEVYVPSPKRMYGYYVLPVLFGDRLIARLDPGFDRGGRVFIIQNWWWQAGVDKKDEAMLDALRDCVTAFCKYLGANAVKLGEPLQKDRMLKAIIKGL